MSRPLAIASASWTVAILAALAGVLLPGEDVRLSLALFAFAVGLGVVVASLMVADGLRRRRSRRRAALVSAQLALDRLDHLPSITTGARRIHWRGARTRVLRDRPQPERGAPAELLGRAPAPLAAASPADLTATAG